MTAVQERPATVADHEDLRGLGYQQELRRDLGSFASFAAGFSFVSILTTVFQLFAFGYSFGGPAFVWTWPVVFVGQLMVALVFAELAATYPLAGCVFQWSRRLGGQVVGWFAGWFMMIGYIVSVAAIAIALQSVLPAVWTGFQVVGGDPALTSKDGATNAVVLGTALIVLATIISALGVKKMAQMNATGVIIEIVGVVLLVVLLFIHSERGPAVITKTNGVQGSGSYLWPLLASALMAAYVMYGFDSAGELSEETRDPRRTAPKAILIALITSGVGGALLLLATLMAAPNLTDGSLSSQGIASVVTAKLGETLGKILLTIVAIAVISACLAIQNSASRVMFSMARDGVLPFSKQLAVVNPHTGTPVRTGVVVSAGAILVLLVNYGQADVFTAVTAVSVVIVYLAYLLVTIPALVQRYRGRRAVDLTEVDPEAAKHGFALGKWGKPVNIAAVIYGLAMLINIGWPRDKVYDISGNSTVLHYFPLIFMAGALLVGAIAFSVVRSRRSSVLTEESLNEPQPTRSHRA
jgi:urea carboxylase system permease